MNDIKNRSSLDRLVSAKLGLHLDQLWNDSSPRVRAAVARHGYKLDVLINDKNDYVASVARAAAKELS